MSFEIETASDAGVITEQLPQEPGMYKVIFFNDDYTTKDYVVHIIMTVFHKSAVEAVILMEQVHIKGSAVIGVYTHDIAATRVAVTIRDARANGFPLRCEMEEE